MAPAVPPDPPARPEPVERQQPPAGERVADARGEGAGRFAQVDEAHVPPGQCREEGVQ